MKKNTDLSARKMLADAFGKNYPCIEKELLGLGASKCQLLPIMQTAFDNLHQKMNREKPLCLWKTEYNDWLLQKCKQIFVAGYLFKDNAQSENEQMLGKKFIALQEDLQKQAFCETIRKFRKKTGLTQEQFYFSTKINIKRYENGLSAPSFMKLCSIIKHLDIDIDEFCKAMKLIAIEASPN